MAESVVRFGVRDSQGRRAATWRCWTNGSTDPSFYVGCRSLGGDFKLSFHGTGECNVSFTKATYDSNFADATRPESRYLEWWQRPNPLAPGVILGCRIYVPGASPSIFGNAESSVFWVGDAGAGRAIEFLIFVTSGPDEDRWPGQRSMNTQLVGTYLLPNRERVWVVFRDTPFQMSGQQQSGAGYYFEGGKEMLSSAEDLRAIAYSVEADGSRSLLDATVQKC